MTQQEYLEIEAEVKNSGIPVPSQEKILKACKKTISVQVDNNDCCPICHTYSKDDNGVPGEYCPNCGQRLEQRR